MEKKSWTVPRTVKYRADSSIYSRPHSQGSKSRSKWVLEELENLKIETNCKVHHFYTERWKLWFLQQCWCAFQHAFPCLACTIPLPCKPQIPLTPSRNVLLQHNFWGTLIKRHLSLHHAPLEATRRSLSSVLWAFPEKQAQKVLWHNSLPPLGLAPPSSLLSLGWTAREQFCSNALPGIRWSCNIYRYQSITKEPNKK